MPIFQSIMVVLLMIVLPIVLGDLLSYFSGIHEDICFSGLLFRYTTGNTLMWAIFQLIAVPLILFKTSFSYVVVLWGGIMCVGAALFLKKRSSLFTAELYAFAKNVKKKCSQFRFTKSKSFTFLCMLIALVIMGIQCYMYIFKMHLDEDDSRYIVNALEAYNNNTMLLTNPATGEYEGTWVGELAKDVVSPWMIYLAVLAKMTRIHPAIFVHTILPSFLLIMSYSAFWLMADHYFKKNFQNCCIFVAIVAFINMYFNDSTHTQSFVALVRIWQGKAVVAGVMIPVLFYLLMLLYQEYQQKYLFVLIFISAMAMSLLSGVGIMISGIMIGTYGLWSVCVNKAWRMFPWLCAACIPSALYGLVYVVI